MESSASRNVHSFHIPVLGTGYTIDTPLRVAKYGISSVISLTDDILVERMRKFYCEKEGQPYEEITSRQQDARALRITAYLNLLDRLIERQVAALQASPFEPESEITSYYEMLPDTSLKQDYLRMLATRDLGEKTRMQDQLRRLATPGSIDVNIMSKLDRDVYHKGKKLPAEFCTAMAALRGYANSTLRSSVVFSAGMNPRLYGYIAQFEDFLPDADGLLKKKVVLKVSDHRSAVIQGKFLAKHGVWVSEYRIESGLNCGGHAFPTKGLLMGPILEEFRDKKEESANLLHRFYGKALKAAGHSPPEQPPSMRITVQGGIGTAAEDKFLLDYYEVDGTGWATPFMLVPEVTNVDEKHLNKLVAATDDDVYLSSSSPMGIPFWNLRSSASEEARRSRIANGCPGTPCPKGYLRGNTEFTEIPICTASRQYQQRRLEILSEEGIPAEQLDEVRERVLAKSCICQDLAGGVLIKNGIDLDVTPSICPGPNIVNFSKIATLKEMVSHIYGRMSLLTHPNRPHMLTREIMLYVDCLRKELERFSTGLLSSTPEYLREFSENLLGGIEYYRDLAEQFVAEERRKFLDELDALREAIESGMVAAASCD